MYQCYTDNVFLQQLNAPQANGSPETPRVRFADDEVQAEAYTLRAASDAGAVKIVIDGAAFTREHGPSWALLLSGVLGQMVLGTAVTWRHSRAKARAKADAEA